MDKNKISLEHLFNPPKMGVGRVYENAFEGFELSNQFLNEQIKLSTFFNNCKIEETIFILIKAYKEKYPSTSIMKIYNYNTENMKKGLFKRSDLEIEWETLIKGLDYIQINFKKNVNISMIKTNIEEALIGKQFNLNANVYKVTDSPIDTINFSESSVNVKIHQNRVVNY